MQITIRKSDNKLVCFNGDDSALSSDYECVDIDIDSIPSGDLENMYFENGEIVING